MVKRTYKPRKLKGTIKKSDKWKKDKSPVKGSYSDRWVFTGELPYMCTKKRVERH